jgi:hypothetical protein
MTDLERDLRDMMHRTADGLHHAPVATPGLVRRARVRRARTAALTGAATVALVIGGFGVRSAVWTDAAPVPPADRRGSEIEQDPEIQNKSITRQVAIIKQMADAINARDTDAFIDVFARDGEFHPPGGRVGTSPKLTDGQPVADAALVRAWMAINEAWNLKAEVIACGRMTGPIRRSSDRTDVFVECDVRARWHKLSLEVVEGWNFEFDGTELLRWGLSKPMTLTDILDLNPPNRSLPLGYDGLLAWEEWLEANHPDAAARYLNPRAEGPPHDCVSGCQKAWDEAGELAPLLLFGPDREWSINGYEFRPSGYIPYDPAYSDEIQVSIQEYLDGR